MTAIQSLIIIFPLKMLKILLLWRNVRPIRFREDEVIRIRSKEEIVKRTLGTVLISIYSECLLNTKLGMDMADAREYVYNAMKNYGLTDLAEVMSPKELAYFNDDNSDERTRIDHSWRYENVYLLEWALGMDPSVVHARHKTLNWLICFEDSDWDDVDIPT